MSRDESKSGGARETEVVFCASADAFLQAARAGLEVSEAEHNLLLGLAEGIAAGAKPFVEPAVFATAVAGGQLRGALLRTPPRAWMIMAADREMAEQLAVAAFARAPDCPGVVGSDPRSREFAERWSALSGRAAQRVLAMHVYELTAVTDNGRRVAGAMRMAAPADLAQVGDWIHAFSREALPHEAGDRAAAMATAERRVGASEIFLWESGGESVAMAGYARASRRTSAINAVYTPPSLRGRGYASALVAAMSARALAAGKRACVLFTDRSNPTSNAIYQRIGYRHVCDSEHWTF